MMPSLHHQLSKPELSHYIRARLAEDWVPGLKDRRLFKMFVPRVLGGLELSLEEATQRLIETAEFSGSLGWIHNLASGANFFCGYFDEETATELFRSPEVICSGSGAPTGRIRVYDAYMMASGRWNFCSAADQATHFTATALNEQEQPVTFICDAAGVELRDSWRAFGLKASGTRQMVMTDQKVPRRYQFEIGRQQSFFDYPIYRIDFETFARICLSATWQGIVQGFLGYVEQESADTDKEISNRTARIGKKLHHLQNRRTAFARQLQENAYQPKDPDAFREQVKTTLAEQHRNIYAELSGLCWQLGLLITDESRLSHWAWRDLQTASQHFFVK
jgi:alkylation response protein AidB-like acyl-CoA dehydrogenase